MNIDTNNSFGGKVKFLQGGGGSPPVVEQVVPLLIGSNYSFNNTFYGFLELPLNIRGTAPFGLQNKSFIVQDVVVGFKNWFVKSNLQFYSDFAFSVEVDIVVQLIIDESVVDTQTITIGNSGYQGEINFDLQTSPSSITQSIYYRIDIYDSGTSTPSTIDFTIPSSTTLLYSSVYAGGLRYDGFLSSYIGGSPTINDSTTAIFGNFGGSAYLDANAFNPIQNVIPIDGFNALGVYFSLQQITAGSNTSNRIRFSLIVDGVATEIATSIQVPSLLPSTFYYASLDNLVQISKYSTLYLLIDLLSADGSSISVNEIGLIYRVDL